MELGLHTKPLAVSRNPHHSALSHCFRFATRPLELPSKQFASEILKRSGYEISVFPLFTLPFIPCLRHLLSLWFLYIGKLQVMRQ